MSPFAELHKATRSGNFQKWVWRVLIILAFSGAVLLWWNDRSEDREQDDRDRAVLIRGCKDTRMLFQAVILRNLNVTPEEYAEDPERALRTYRKVLEASQFYRNDPDALNEAVKRTREILELADPALCPDE